MADLISTSRSFSSRRVCLFIVAALIALQFTACARRSVQAPMVAASVRLPYVDLREGWRLSIVSPLDDSGAITMPVIDEAKAECETGAQATRSPTVVARAPKDFAYLKALVGLRSSRYGLSFRVESSERIQGDSVAKLRLPEPLLKMLPAESGLARILFLTRYAEEEHDMAILGARRHADLEALTEAVIANPANGCQVTASVWCQWVPRGVAVRVEMPSPDGKRGDWVPVL